MKNYTNMEMTSRFKVKTDEKLKKRLWETVKCGMKTKC